METESVHACELRTMLSEQGLLNQADGSAVFKQGDTQVMAAVYGPVEVRMNKELLDKALVEVIFRPKVGLPGCSEKMMEQLIRQSCEPVILTTLHPRSSMTIIVQVIHDSGSLLSCAINAAFLAMIDAGYPMKSTICSVTCAITNNDEIQLDPNLQQQKEASSVMTFVFDGINKNVMTSSTKGEYAIEQYNKCLLASVSAADHILQFFRQSVERKLSRDAKYQCIDSNSMDS
ncbi:exosome complex component RRP46 [Exaiptasia diaphana]|uniref:Exosome complex component RRP46 n=1 Tax=Exaiptasia diaphana TaxID=2652724 RepID=A0A913XB37_EXADI|nr:exosome complex component RRP46 [Exaiptasia diaphana]KXJ13414.1 Exosome complex component RRP46 [Exaiptasia diaphana]